MIKRPCMPRTRRFLALTPQTRPTPAVREIERLQRENAELREMRDDIMKLVCDLNLRRLTVVSVIVTINAIRKLVMK